jgi:superfamily II DNA or RNA helicase
VLEIAALHGDVLGMRRFIEVGRPLTAGGEFSPGKLGRALTDLVGRGLLIETEHDYLCPRHLAEEIALASRRSGRAALITAQMLKLEPWSGRLQRDPKSLWRHFRLHLYAGDWRQSKGLATDLERLGRQPWAEVGWQLASVQSFLEFPPEIALLLARDTVIFSLNTPVAAPQAVQALGQLIRDPAATPREQQLYGHCLLMMERHQELDELLEEFDFPILEGCRKLLAGNPQGLEDFHRGLRGSRAFPSYTALFLYLVALAAREGLDSPGFHDQAARYENFRLPFQWLAEVKSGQTHQITPLLREKLERLPDGIVPHCALILHWAGFRFEGFRLAQRAEEYSQAGYPVFAQWLRHADQGELTAPELAPPLVGLLQADQRWQKALLALNAWAEPGQGPAAEQERLVWHIEPFVARREVEPRLQKLSRRGVWSSGRLLPLDEIAAKPPECADEHDHRVLDAMRRVITAPRYGLTVSRSELQNAALLGLVGHPRVYLTKSPETTVELELQPVALLVRSLSDHLELKLEPYPMSMPMVTAQPAGPGKVHLFHFTDRLVQLSRVIDTGLKVPVEGQDQLQSALARLASAGLTVRSDIPLSGPSQESAADPTLRVRLSPYAEGLSVQVRVAPLGDEGPVLVPGQGAPVVAGRVAGAGRQVRRDLALEALSWQQLETEYPQLQSTDFVLQTPLQCLTFLESFVGIEDPRFRLEWPEGERFAVTRRLGLPQLGQKVRAGGDWFSIGARAQVDHDLFYGLGELLEARRAAVGRFLPLEGGRFVALTEQVERHLERLERLAQRRARGELQLHPLSAVLALEDQEVEADQGFHAVRERLRDAQEWQPDLPAGLHAQLRDYQAEGVRWLLRLARWGVGACLADDMGLGKTLQLLAVLLQRAALGPALVVAPTSVCWNWIEEARRFAPALSLRPIGQALPEDLGPHDVLVVSYGLLVNHAQGLQAVAWATVVLDEAQAIKNAGTQRARAAQGLPAEFRVAASGTPVENHPEEMWSLFSFLNPGLLGSRKAFGQRFAGPAGQRELARLVRPFILRRTKDQVLTELPPRTEITERVILSPGERALYENLRQEAVLSLREESEQSYLSVLAHLSRLRLACCHPRLLLPQSALSSAKLERCLELLEELRENGHRVLVFSQFVSFLEILRQALQPKVRLAYLDGSTPAAARRKEVKAFQDGERDVFLISLKAGGTGINLTAADYVIHLDPWWNPAVEDQASDRAHRMGQQRPVTVYRLVAQDSIEETIVDLHQQKRDLARRLLEGTESSHRLSTAELIELLGYTPAHNILHKDW